MPTTMPTAREFEDAAIDFCLDNSGVGVWAMRQDQVNRAEYDITVRLGGRYRVEQTGVAVVRVTYDPQQEQFICRPAEEPSQPDTMVLDDPSYLFT
jgi:hypothetical protein